MKALLISSFKVGEAEVKDKDLLVTCLNQSPEKGFDVVEMEARLKVLAKVKAAEGDTVSLEDAEAEKIKFCVDNMRWSVIDQGIVDLIKRVKAL